MKKAWAIFGRIMYILAWPALYLLFKGTKRTRVIVSCGDRVLFVKDWLGTGSWKLPGGGIHKNEDPTEAAIRELREETGIEVSKSELTKIDDCEINESEMPYRCFVYATKIANTKVKIKRQKMEISDIAWLNVDKYDELNISKATRQLLRLWRQQS